MKIEDMENMTAQELEAAFNQRLDKLLDDHLDVVSLRNEFERNLGDGVVGVPSLAEIAKGNPDILRALERRLRERIESAAE